MSKISRRRRPARRRGLPRQTPQQILARLDRFMLAMGDLSAYIAGFNVFGGIVLITFVIKPACPTLPIPTRSKFAAQPDDLDRACRALEIVARAREQGKPVRYTVKQCECLGPDGKPDAALTAKVLKERPPMETEPAIAGQRVLPRLTPRQIKASLSARLREGADVAAYFLSTDPQGGLYIRTFPPSGRLPPPSRDGASVHKERLDVFERAIRQYNDYLAGGPAPPFKLQPQ